MVTIYITTSELSTPVWTHAAFALAYLRVTEAYRRTVEDPGFFDDTPFLNHQAAVFAGAWFGADESAAIAIRL